MLSPTVAILYAAFKCEQDFIQVLWITWPRTIVAQAVCIGLTTLLTPLPDGFAGQNDPPSSHELFDIAVAKGKTEGEPDTVADDFRRESVIIPI